MNRKLLALSITFVFTATTCALALQPVAANPIVNVSNQTCNSLVVKGTADGPYTVTILVYDLTSGGTLIGFGNTPAAGFPPFSYSVTVPFSGGTPGNSISVAANDPPGGSTTVSGLTIPPCSPGNSPGGSASFFNPQDGSVNRRAGDRIAIYPHCNASPPNVVIYGIDNSARGYELTRLSFDDLIAAHSGTFIKNLGLNGIILYDYLDAANLHIAWKDGPFGATAQGDWANTIPCTMPPAKLCQQLSDLDCLMLEADHHWCWSSIYARCRWLPAPDVPYLTQFIIDLNGCFKAKATRPDGKITISDQFAGADSIGPSLYAQELLICPPPIHEKLGNRILGDWILIVTTSVNGFEHWFYANAADVKYDMK